MRGELPLICLHCEVTLSQDSIKMGDGLCAYCRNVSKIDETYSSSHYTSKREGLEAIDVIEAFDLNRNLANVCKYILRCNHKGQRDSDLEKAINYLWRERYGTWLPKFEAICPAANCKKQVYPGGRFCEWHADLVDKKGT